jgi:site-specific DNA-methyltransferase (adenine-specific)
MRRHPRCALYLGDCLKIFPALRAVRQVSDLIAWWREIDRVTTESAVVAVFSAQPFTTALINSRPKLFRYDLVWDKIRAVGHLNANRQPMRQHEQVLIFCRRPSLSTYRPQLLPGRPYTSRKKAGAQGSIYRHAGAATTVNLGTRHATSILRFDKPGQREWLHPTEKPLQLLN